MAKKGKKRSADVGGYIPPMEDNEPILEQEKEADEKEVAEEIMVPKVITCPRCKGSGTFVSNKTGYRAKTSSEPLEDPERDCPDCKGSKKKTIIIPESQHIAEQEALAAEKAAKKAEIDASAQAAKDRIDNGA